MGRTANITKALEELSNQFKPQELNEGNVQAIFNRCLATKDTRNISRAQLFLINMGYQGKEDCPIHFDKGLLLNNKSNIEYLYGQLNSVHAGIHYKDNLSISDFNRDYTGNIWTIKPPLSPKGPNFPAWWEAHKSEWEA